MSRPQGLDPAIAVELMGGLRRLADAGSTVVLTTHSLQDLGHCDRIVFLTHGCLAFAGTPEEAQSHFEVESLEKVYQRLATEGTAADWATRFGYREVIAATTQTPSQAPPEARHRVGPVRQLTVLTRRTLDTIVRNRLTLAILLGSPLLVVAMFAVLFRPGAFAFEDPSPSAIVMILYWVSFAGFPSASPTACSRSAPRWPSCNGTPRRPAPRALCAVQARGPDAVPARDRRLDARRPASAWTACQRTISPRISPSA